LPVGGRTINPLQESVELILRLILLCAGVLIPVRAKIFAHPALELKVGNNTFERPLMPKTIFLSHIHEEHELAGLIQEALEEEFSGFVNTFVSSDGVSIPAGANFLRRIEDGLVDCVGAIYLISPSSVRRSWVNFELGAVWIRNSMSIRAGGAEIPTVPACHSGITPADLPVPLNNLNSIIASQSSHLELAFRSLQSAVGGKGKLRTNFDDLAARIANFEQAYTLGMNFARMLRLVSNDLRPVVQHCEQLPEGVVASINCGFLETSTIQQLESIATAHMAGKVQVKVGNSSIRLGVASGAENGAEVTLFIPADLVCRFKSEILKV
jgi:hypothetical protein